jgi:radical SAM protein with 4Fe4S-binding SPASM domain
MKEIENSIRKSVSIELTSACNIKCFCCPVGNGVVEPRHMSMGDFKAIVDLLPKEVRQLDFSHRGDPTMNPNLVSMIEYASSRGLKTDMYTNGMLLDRYAHELVRSGLTRIRIDLDGASQESYGQFRIGGDFERVRSNVELLVEEREKAGSDSSLRIILICVVTVFNEHEIPAIREMAEALGVDRLLFKAAAINYGTKYYRDEDEQKGIAPKNPEFRRAGRKEDFVCPFLRRGAILHNGDLLVCTCDFEGKLCLGNILEEGSFEKVFFSSQAEKVRRSILDETEPLCQSCPVSGENHYLEEISCKFPKRNRAPESMWHRLRNRVIR